MAYRVNLKYNPVTDADIIARLEEQENKQHYIRRLILADIAADKLLTLQDDIASGAYKARIAYWEEHCAAATDPEAVCENCPYWTNGCTIESAWNQYKETLEVSENG